MDQDTTDVPAYTVVLYDIGAAVSNQADAEVIARWSDRAIPAEPISTNAIAVAVDDTVVDYLSRAPARLIVYDILLTEPDLRRFTVGDDEWTGQESDPGDAPSRWCPTAGPPLALQTRSPSMSIRFTTCSIRRNSFSADVQPKVDPATFRDKIVVVSATASGTYELQFTPFAQQISGRENHANVIDSLLRGRSIVPLGRSRAIALTFAVAIALGLLGAVAGVWTLALGGVILAAVVTWFSVRLLVAGLWMPLVTPLIAVGLTFVGELAWQYFVEGREKRGKEEPKKEEPKKKGFGLGRLLPTGGGEQKSTQANASGGTRGVDPETNAKGGPNPKLVPVKLVAADYAAFKKEGGLK